MDVNMNMELDLMIFMGPFQYSMILCMKDASKQLGTDLAWAMSYTRRQIFLGMQVNVDYEQ